MVAAMDARLAALAAKGAPRPEGHRVAAQRFYGRAGFAGEILSRRRFVNLAAELSLESYGQIALEAVALGGADILILNTTPDGPPSLAHEILNHPVIAKLGDRLKLVALPSYGPDQPSSTRSSC